MASCQPVEILRDVEEEKKKEEKKKKTKRKKKKKITNIL